MNRRICRGIRGTAVLVEKGIFEKVSTRNERKKEREKGILFTQGC